MSDEAVMTFRQTSDGKVSLLNDRGEDLLSFQRGEVIEVRIAHTDIWIPGHYWNMDASYGYESGIKMECTITPMASEGALQRPANMVIPLDDLTTSLRRYAP